MLRKLLVREARTHSIRFAFRFGATNQKKSCKFTSKFDELKVQNSVSLVVAPVGMARHCHYRESLSRQKEQKTIKWHDGKNEFRDSDRGILRGRGRLKAYYMAIRGEPRAFEHQPRRQKICERELRIRVDCKALENILFGLRSAGARVLVVHVSHQLQALSTSQSCITSRE